MTVCSPYHSIEPRHDGVYHNNSACPVGRTIIPAYLRDGIGAGRHLCPDCVALDVGVWGHEPEHPLDLDNDP